MTTALMLPEDLQLKIVHHMMADRSLEEYKAGILTCKAFKETLMRTYSDSVRLQARIQAFVDREGKKPCLERVDMALTDMPQGFSANVRLSGEAQPVSLVFTRIAVAQGVQLTVFADLEKAVRALEATSVCIKNIMFKLNVPDQVDLIGILSSQGFWTDKILNELIFGNRWVCFTKILT